MENWDKIVHVKSSLEAKHGQFAMFIGRWQPLHVGHKKMFAQALLEKKNVLICIRDTAAALNPEPTEKEVSIVPLEFNLTIPLEEVPLYVVN